MKLVENAWVASDQLQTLIEQRRQAIETARRAAELAEQQRQREREQELLKILEAGLNLDPALRDLMSVTYQSTTDRLVLTFVLPVDGLQSYATYTFWYNHYESQFMLWSENDDGFVDLSNLQNHVLDQMIWETDQTLQGEND
jgi:hypothetical protein